MNQMFDAFLRHAAPGWWTVVLIGSVFLGCAVPVTAYASSSSSETKSQSYQLGNLLVRIPDGYAATNSGQSDGLVIQALLPKLSPESANEKLLFSAPGMGQNILASITLNPLHENNSDTLKAYKKQSAMPLGTRGQFEVTALPEIASILYQSGKTFFICNEPSKEFVQPLILSCVMIDHFKLIGSQGRRLDVTFQVTISRRYVDSLPDITKGVEKMVGSWVQ